MATKAPSTVDVAESGQVAAAAAPAARLWDLTFPGGDLLVGPARGAELVGLLGWEDDGLTACRWGG